MSTLNGSDHFCAGERLLGGAADFAQAEPVREASFALTRSPSKRRARSRPERDSAPKPEGLTFEEIERRWHEQGGRHLYVRVKLPRGKGPTRICAQIVALDGQRVFVRPAGHGHAEEVSPAAMGWAKSLMAACEQRAGGAA